MRTCYHCLTSYLSAKSSSSLRLTYCSALCEIAEEGFSLDPRAIASWTSSEPARPRQEPLEPAREAVLATI